MVLKIKALLLQAGLDPRPWVPQMLASSAVISGLTPASLYYYRLVKNAGGSHISDAANFARSVRLSVKHVRLRRFTSSATLNVRVVGTGGFRQELQGTDPLSMITVLTGAWMKVLVLK